MRAEASIVGTTERQATDSKYIPGKKKRWPKNALIINRFVRLHDYSARFTDLSKILFRCSVSNLINRQITLAYNKHDV